MTINTLNEFVTSRHITELQCRMISTLMYTDSPTKPEGISVARFAAMIAWAKKRIQEFEN